jgi:phosphatidylglycerol:prolipoprotein diacylglycerol transferase
LAYIRKREIDFKDITDILVPSVLLFHVFGRLGCFFAGCCYGRETTWAIAINGLIPVQLIESGFNLLILMEILLFRPERERPGVLFPMYLTVYACGRFLLEFMRGDASRGAFLIFSTSQWISVSVKLKAQQKCTKNTALAIDKNSQYEQSVVNTDKKCYPFCHTQV